MPTYLSPGVYVEEMEGGARPIEGVGTAVAAFIGVAQQGPVNEPTLVTNWSQFNQTFGDFIEGSYLDDAVYGYFLNGGGACYVVRVNGNGQMRSAAGELPRPSQAKVGSYTVRALDPGPAGNDITVEITDATPTSPPEPEEKSEQGDQGEGDKPEGEDKGGTTKQDEGPPAFKILVKKGNEVQEEYDHVTTEAGRQNAATVVNSRSRLIRLTPPSAGPVEVPSKGTVKLGGGEVSESARLTPDDYVGDAADRTGFGGLEAIDPVTMVACPDLMAAYQGGLIDLEGVQAVQLAMIAHCEQMGDRVAILDPPPGLNAQQIREWRVDKVGYDSKYAALYWPWVKVFDPVTAQNMFVPPSGHMAGIWGRSDDARGVHKAPANEVVRGALGLEIQITRTEHDLLNPHGINCIRAFPGRGIRVWGARTISSDPAWRYLNVRRLFNYLEESILAGTQWAVFEPNDHALWAKLRRTIASFLVNEWRKGALFGLTPEEAFYVKCDEETNPPEQVDAGMVVCEIGVSPVKPAEFVVFRLSQFSGGAAVEE